MAKGGKVKGPSLLELREQLKQMNLDAEGPNVEGTGRELVPATGGMLDPVQSGTPTLEQIEQLARQPERPTGTVSRRDFLEGAAALMSPLPDPTSLITPNPFEGAPLLDPATNVAKAAPIAALTPAQIAAKLDDAWGWIWETSEDPEFELAIEALEGIPEAETLVKRMQEFDPEDYSEEPWDDLAQEFDNLATKHRVIRSEPDATDEPMRFIPVEPYERSTEDIIYSYVDEDTAQEILGDPKKFGKFESLLKEYIEVVARGPEGWEELTPKQQARIEKVVTRLEEEFGFDIDSFGFDIG